MTLSVPFGIATFIPQRLLWRGSLFGLWRIPMLMTLALVLILLWLLGMVSAYTMGGLIHILLVVAVVVVLVRVIQGRKIV